MLCAIGVWGGYHHLSQPLQQQICCKGCTYAMQGNLRQQVHVGKTSGPVNKQQAQVQVLAYACSCELETQSQCFQKQCCVQGHAQIINSDAGSSQTCQLQWVSSSQAPAEAHCPPR